MPPLIQFVRQFIALNIHFRNIRGDIFGGLTAGIVALPLALAFGVTSGLGAAAGLYGAIGVGLMAALFGGTPSQISGPTGPMTVVAATVVASLSDNPTVIFTAFMLAGLFQIVMGFFQVGTYIRYVPYPVVSGFMSGIGLIIILLQFNPLIGRPAVAKIPDVLHGFVNAWQHVNASALMLGLLSMTLIYLFPLLTKAIPSTLVALIGCTALASALQLHIPVIGEIPAGFDAFYWPMLSFDGLTHILVPALTLAALGAIDSLLTSLVADNLTKTTHDSNRELVGQGLGNMLSGILGGIPGAGATMRTVVNIRSGGQSGLSGVIHSVVLVAVLFGLGPLAARIPLSVLAGILMTVGIGIIDYKGVRHLRVIPKSDAFVMLTVAGLTVFVDLLQAVGVGMVISALLFLKKYSSFLEKQLNPVPLSQYGQPSAPGMGTQDLGRRIYVQHIEGPLFFGFALSFQNSLANIPDVGAVILRMERVPYIDQSGLYALEEVVHYLRNQDIPIVLTGVSPVALTFMQRTHLIPELIPAAHIVSNFEQSLDSIAHLLSKTPEQVSS